MGGREDGMENSENEGDSSLVNGVGKRAVTVRMERSGGDPDKQRRKDNVTD